MACSITCTVAPELWARAGLAALVAAVTAAAPSAAVAARATAPGRRRVDLTGNLLGGWTACKRGDPMPRGWPASSGAARPAASELRTRGGLAQAVGDRALQGALDDRPEP